MRNDDEIDDVMDLEMGVVKMPNFGAGDVVLDDAPVASLEASPVVEAEPVPTLDEVPSVAAALDSDNVPTDVVATVSNADSVVASNSEATQAPEKDAKAEEPKEAADDEMVTITMADGEVVVIPRSRLDMLLQASQQMLRPAQFAPPQVSAIPAENPAKEPAKEPAPPPVNYGQGPYAGAGGVGDGLKGLANGASRLLGGMLSVAGVAAGGVGTGANALVSHLSKKKDAVPGKSALDGLGVGVMPRITDYRAQQVERAVSQYEESAAALWERPGLADVSKAIKDRANALGKPVADVVAGMRSGGDHADLAEAFQTGVAADPLALTAKDRMEKSLSAWTNQNVAATPEIAGGTDDATRRGLKARIESANERMEAAAAIVPPFSDGDESHLQRIQAVMARIVEALKNFVGGLTGRNSAEANHAPAA